MRRAGVASIAIAVDAPVSGGAAPGRRAISKRRF
jgi:hypothetical protein